MLKDRKIYESNLEAQLAQWKADIDVLKAKAKRAEVSLLVKYDQGLDALQKKHEAAGKQLGKLKLAGDDAWDDAKTSTEKVWGEFKALFQSSTKTP